MKNEHTNQYSCTKNLASDMSLRVNFDADYGYERTIDNFKLYTSPMDIGNININI